MGEPERRTVCVDLDGVLNLYQGWTGNAGDFAPPREGAREFLASLTEAGYEVVVLTTRNSHDTSRWLLENDLLFDRVTNVKPKALVYVDDRAIHFDGHFEGLLDVIRAFRPHWLKAAAESS